MKKLASILAVTLAAGVLATGCGSSSGSASKDSSSDSGKTVIKAATGANAKPYVYVGDDDKPAGYDVDVLNAVFDKLPDYELEYEVTDFGSVLSGLNSGNYQIGVNNFSYNEDRGASYLYSYSYDNISYVFVTKKGGKEIKSFEDAARVMKSYVEKMKKITLCEKTVTIKSAMKDADVTAMEELADELLA